MPQFRPLECLLILPLALLCACAGADHRLEGTNYARDLPPYVADVLETRAPAPGLPRSDGSLVHRLVLIGDAGDDRENAPTLRALGRWGDAHADRTTVLFLGDNLYMSGLRDEGHAERARDERILRSQIDATRARRIFAPGNHDWGIPDISAARLHNEQVFVDAEEGAEFLPKDGCPGPARRILAEAGRLQRGVALVVVDLQWWLLPPDERPDCDGLDEAAAVAALQSTLDELSDHWVIVGAHHPLTTGGPHGGLSYGALADFLLGMVKLYYGSLQNTYEPNYAHAIVQISDAMAESRPLAFAGGHDHSLQLLQGGPAAHYEIVSGAGSTKKVSTVTNIEPTLFAHAHPGFVVLDFHARAGGDEILFHVVEAGAAAPVLTTRLSAP